MPGPIDDVIAQMPPGSWKELSNTHMADVCPLPYDHYWCGAVMGAWSGAAFDTVRDRLVVHGGGHADSYYNNVFAFDLASMTWQRMTELPAGLNGNTYPPAVYQDKRIETCGLYPSGSTLTIPDAWLTATGYLSYDKCDDPSIAPQLDPQQPRSRHTYGNVAFSAATGKFYLLGATGLWQSGQTGTSRVMAFDFESKQWSRAADNPVAEYGASAADENGHIWYAGNHSLMEFDPVANTWTPRNSDALGWYYAGADIDPKRHTLVFTADGLTLYTYAIAQAGAPVTTVKTTGITAPIGNATGLAYDPVLDRFVAWSGGPVVYFLDPQTWHVTAVTGTGDVPTPGALNGTFGRFRYSPARNVFIAVNATEEDVFIYKPPTAAP
ncbi:MAG: kelch repeat-containing protein [Minicystis sp.]